MPGTGKGHNHLSVRTRLPEVAAQGFLQASALVDGHTDPSLAELRSNLEQSLNFGFEPGLIIYFITRWQLEKSSLIFPMLAGRSSNRAKEVGALSQRMCEWSPLYVQALD